ncbi:hypothetical protein PanWU01x14_369660, partial [Parasponia andersonii]
MPGLGNNQECRLFHASRLIWDAVVKSSRPEFTHTHTHLICPRLFTDNLEKIRQAIGKTVGNCRVRQAIGKSYFDIIIRLDDRSYTYIIDYGKIPWIKAAGKKKQQQQQQ